MSIRETMFRAGEELRRLREERHITQQEMEKRTAERFGHENRVYAQQVSRIEKGQLDKPPIIDLLRVGQILGLTPDDIAEMYDLWPRQKERKAEGLQRLDPRLRGAIDLVEELPSEARERFLAWIEFATLQARAEQRTSARSAGHTASSAAQKATGKVTEAAADTSRAPTTPDTNSTSTRTRTTSRTRTRA